jgi:hypothetical protein
MLEKHALPTTKYTVVEYAAHTWSDMKTDLNAFAELVDSKDSNVVSNIVVV